MRDNSSPRDQDEIIPRERQLRPTQLLRLIGALAAGISVALVFLYHSFVWIPTDVRRLGVLVSALQRAEQGVEAVPAVVVFGNSVLMSGIDARLMSDRLHGNPLAWNCASNGQTFLEAFLLTEELPHEVDTSVYGLSIRAGIEDDPLHPQKYNTMFMNGYRPAMETVELVDSVYDPSVTKLLERSWLTQVFSSRWAVRQFIDTYIRSVLRPDLALSRSTFDLFHPQSYEQKIDPKITKRFLDRRINAFEREGAMIPEQTLKLVDRMIDQSRETNRKVLFLFPPTHPALLESLGDEMNEIVESFRKRVRSSDSTRVVNALELLESNHFIDDMHPTNEGAQILTERLARAIDSPR